MTPARFSSSNKFRRWVGLTPLQNQPGEREASGGITKAGDVKLGRALCLPATVMMRCGRSTLLRTWAAKLVHCRGSKLAMVALARRIGGILHRMWGEGTDLRSDGPRLNVACGCGATHRRLPDRRPSRPPRDAIPKMPWSGRLLAARSTTMRWAHLNCIEPASCWRPPRRPRTEASTGLISAEGGLEIGDKGRSPQSTRSSAGEISCPKELDRGIPVPRGLILVST